LGAILLVIAPGLCATSPAREPDDVHFPVGGAELSDYAQKTLDEVVDRIDYWSKRNVPVTVNVCGYADAAEKSDMALSARRADAVKAYLERKGVALEFIKPAAYGKAYPLHQGSTPEIRDLNRRVEVRFGKCTGAA
jgi:OmpA-OmpF porin, OOP family